ncbi:MAG: tRNA lysidine(34) synthetase TilS [Anaerolineales bacterium]|jgi:tRNA(Ile)-lysidine synthase
MLNKVGYAVRENCHLDPSQTVLLGVSGGPDSLTLLDVMYRLGYPLVVFHLNHGLRAEADEEAKMISEFVQGMELPFFLEQEDVSEYAREKGFSIEEAARNLRYQHLFTQARAVGAHAVAVGHNADDQVETVLMHLLRGAGLSGLKGMQFSTLPSTWSKNIPLVRPLLGVWRKEIEAYVKERNLEPVFDRSNLDTTFFRNRLRHKLIPYLEEYNPRIRDGIWRIARILEGDHQILMALVADAWENCLKDQGVGFLAFDKNRLEAQPLGLKRHLVRRAIAYLRPGLRDVDFDTVQRVLNFLSHPTSTHQIDLGFGLRLFMEQNKLYLAAWEADLPKEDWPQIPEDGSLSLPIPGSLSLDSDWWLRAELWDDVAGARDQVFKNPNPYQAWLDIGRRQKELVVRPRHPGDRFQPLGMGGHSMKISDFMINVKIPKRARERWPLVCLNDEVAWIPGLRLAQNYSVTESTRKVVYLVLEREPK